MQATDNIGRMLLADYQTFPASELAQELSCHGQTWSWSVRRRSCRSRVELARSSALSHGHRKFTMDDLWWTIFDGQSDQNPGNREQRPYTSKLDLRESSL